MQTNLMVIPPLYFISKPKTEQRLIRSMALGLCAAMHVVPEEGQLVSLLGGGYEKTNAQALEYWICKQLIERQISPDPDAFALLESQLHRWASTCMEDTV